MSFTNIHQTINSILQELPTHVTLEAAAKTRSAEEALAAVRAGIQILGYNYVQEAEQIKKQLSDVHVEWHLIGHLQKNKINKAVKLFDLIETIDSLELAKNLDKACEAVHKTMPIFIEINSGRESRKTGVMPDDAEQLIREIAELPHLSVQGLMTMGPWVEDAEELRPFFAATRALFEHLKQLQIRNVQLQHLSMGMSDSYKIAIEEGATIVRLGSILFGPRHTH